MARSGTEGLEGRSAEQGYGHFWLGNRVGTTVQGFPVPDTIFVERVSKIKYGWGPDGSKGWQITLGYPDPVDPALEKISALNSGLSDLGIL